MRGGKGVYRAKVLSRQYLCLARGVHVVKIFNDFIKIFKFFIKFFNINIKIFNFCIKFFNTSEASLLHKGSLSHPD